MSIKIRLARAGSKKRPFYRVVAADSRMPRDGRFIEKLGTYNPLLKKDDNDRVKLDVDKVTVGDDFCLINICYNRAVRLPFFIRWVRFYISLIIFFKVRFLRIIPIFIDNMMSIKDGVDVCQTGVVEHSDTW